MCKVTGQRRTDDTPPPKRGRGHPVTTAERREIAKLRIAGATRDEICQSTGRGAEAVSAALKHPETVSLMARLGQQYEDRLAALYGRVLEAVEQDLKSEVAYLRSQAQDRALRLIEAGDKARGLLAQAQAQAAPGEGQAGQYTLTEVMTVLRQVQTQTLGEGDEKR